MCERGRKNLEVLLLTGDLHIPRTVFVRSGKVSASERYAPAHPPAGRLLVMRRAGLDLGHEFVHASKRRFPVPAPIPVDGFFAQDPAQLLLVAETLVRASFGRQHLGGLLQPAHLPVALHQVVVRPVQVPREAELEADREALFEIGEPRLVADRYAGGAEDVQEDSANVVEAQLLRHGKHILPGQDRVLIVAGQHQEPRTLSEDTHLRR